MRIVSLVPSVTETLTAWDRPPIACTRFCERSDLTHVGGTKDPDVEHIAQLEPDLVVVDAEENRREDFDDLMARGLEVHVLHVRSLDDIDPAMEGLARHVGATWSPPPLVAARSIRSRAFIPIWRNPWISLGTPTYGASLLAHLGIAALLVGAGPYPRVELDEVITRHPDVVIAPSEPYPFSERQLGELSRIAPVRFVDGRDLFWWGARTAAAVERLARVLDDLNSH